MNYAGFFCIGVGILTTAIGLLCLAISLFSKELPIRQKARRYAFSILPIALLLLGIGGYLVGNSLHS